MRQLLTLTTALTLAANTAAVAQPADTTHISRDPIFTAKDAWVAAAFVAGTIALHPADRYFARKLQAPNNQENRFLRELARELRFIGTPGTTIIGVSMYAVGRVAKVDRMADLGLHGTEAVLLAQQAVGLLKGTVGRARPEVSIEDERSFVLGRGFRKGGDLYRSFPSGHSALGFAAAAAVTSETSKWWPNSTWYVAPIMYGGATLIAASRMYHNKHWASDVVMGAAIGTFAGMKVVHYHHSHPGNRIDKWLLRPSVQRMANGHVALGLAIEMR
jgi:membrane-associated phospholipid phosphatase